MPKTSLFKANISMVKVASISNLNYFLVVTGANIFPVIQMVKTGEPLHIICHSYTIPIWTHSYYYYNLVNRENVSVNEKYIFQNNIYIKRTSKEVHSGTFKCHGTGISGKSFIACSDVHIGGMCMYIFQVKT